MDEKQETEEEIIEEHENFEFQEYPEIRELREAVQRLWMLRPA
jgi:hypothetical protein|tara:strand:- start:1274 stop:1402 length:129 start_codon:yes stop_codon:yes gene_type:complete